MTAPFRCPIIYPGVPIEPAIGKWHRVHLLRLCFIGGEDMRPGTIARWTGRGYECRDHAEAMRDRHWIRIYHPAACTLGTEPIPMGGWARLAVDGEGWECRDHVRMSEIDAPGAAA